ncbi:DUF1697 domain-containing protein [Sphingomonas aracearum]|nr:DUF1697 domain-containing protein [Sphingomonas aracearum]
MRWAALLRAVNVGGTGRLPMAELKALVEAEGFGNVRTLLASGNVVFEADEIDPAALAAQLEEATRRRGLTTDYLLRTAADLHREMAANPFPVAAAERPERLLLTFLREPLGQEAFARLQATHDGPEALHATDRVLYVDYLDRETMRASRPPQAMRNARFPAVATARNWNTVTKLRALLA